MTDTTTSFDDLAEQHGLTERDGEWLFSCVSCGEDTPVYCDPEEFMPEYHYCGRSPRCCP